MKDLFMKWKIYREQKYWILVILTLLLYMFKQLSAQQTRVVQDVSLFSDRKNNAFYFYEIFTVLHGQFFICFIMHLSQAWNISQKLFKIWQDVCQVSSIYKEKICQSNERCIHVGYWISTYVWHMGDLSLQRDRACDISCNGKSWLYEYWDDFWNC